MANENYTLSDLVARLGPATEAEVRPHVEGLDNAALTAKGRRVATPRLAKELARNFGVFADWLPKASQEQIEAVGFGQDWLRLAVWTASEAERLHGLLRRGSSGGADDKELREVTADKLRTRARNARDRLSNALLGLSGQIPTWVTQIQQAAAKAYSEEPAADALEALGDIADALLADSSPGMVARRQTSTLTAAAVSRHRALGAELRAASKAATAARKASEVSQQDVDVWDGMALAFFERFVESLETAREEDPTLPAPTIIGLRSFFGRGGGGGGDEASQAQGAPAGGAAQGTATG